MNRAQITALGLALLLLGGILLLGFGRIRADRVDFNLADGSMRIRTCFLGLTFSEETIPPELTWLAAIPDGAPSDPWVPFSVTTGRIYPGHEAFGKRVGMVYQDALVLAGLSLRSAALRAAVERIRRADSTEIWQIRDALRHPSMTI
jgi:hypothetical protein